MESNPNQTGWIQNRKEMNIDNQQRLKDSTPESTKEHFRKQKKIKPDLAAIISTHKTVPGVVWQFKRDLATYGLYEATLLAVAYEGDGYKAGLTDSLIEWYKKETAKLPLEVTHKRPSNTALYKMIDDGIAKATDGCRVEPDGHCPHGHPAWTLLL